MANKKKEVFRPGPMTEGKRNIIQGLLQEYDIQSAADIQEAGAVHCLQLFRAQFNSFILSHDHHPPALCAFVSGFQRPDRR